MTGNASGMRVVVAVVIAGCLSACRSGPAAPAAPSSAPSLLPITFQSQPLSFPAGAARLQIWGHTLISFEAPLCSPVLGSWEGSSVTTPVQVERVSTGERPASGRNSWIIRSDPSMGTIEFRLEQTGTATIYGERLSGRIHGRARDARLIPEANPRDLAVNLPDASPPLVVEGNGSTVAPFMEGTIRGAIDFTDSYGGRIDCPQVFWLLTPQSPQSPQ